MLNAEIINLHKVGNTAQKIFPRVGNGYLAITFCSTLTHCFCINVTSGGKGEKILGIPLVRYLKRGITFHALPGRKTQPGNSIGSQRTSPVGVPNFGALDRPIEWRFLSLHNTICVEFQCKNPLQEYLEGKHTMHHRIA